MPGKKKIILFRPDPGQLARLVGARLPVALLRVASLIHEDFQVVIVDQAIDTDWEAHLRRELASGDPLVFGVGTITGPQLKGAVKATEMVKALAPDVKTVWGGVYPTLCAQDLAGDPRIDFAIIGEGEHVFRDLVGAMERGADPGAITGLAYSSRGQVVNTGRRPFLDMDTLPPLPLHLLDVQRYLFSDFGADGLLEFETSRGCPHACTYCYNEAYNNRRWRALSPERVLDEMEHLHRHHGVRGLGFLDDEFFIDLKRVHSIMEGIQRRNIKMKLIFQGARVDTFARMSDDTLNLLDRSGTISIQFGIESGSQAILDSIHKGYEVEQAIRQNRRLAACNSIVPYYNFLVGFPGETKSDIDASVRLGWRLLRDNPRARLGPYHILLPYPGSAIFELAVKQGFRPPTTPEGWSDLDFHSRVPPWITDDLFDHIKRVTVASIFVDDKIPIRTRSRLARYASLIYKPVAQWRFRTQRFGLMPERHIFRLLGR